MKFKLYTLSVLWLCMGTFSFSQNSLNKAPEWTTSADGILPGLLHNLQLQATTLYGYSAASLGDINNDGYDDVAVSAPGMANVITGSGNLLHVGAVFIYLGSASGLSTTPAKILQPSTAEAGALFGLSIDAGDVTGDNIPDIIVGAPLDSYQTTAAGLLGDVNVTVSTGKVYVYRSEDLFGSANPSPFLELRLQGHDFFSTGVLGLLNNITVKGLFGYSVAVTDDLNGDNKKDIVIGAPAYVGTAALSVQSGAAFVYYSNNLSTTSPVQLNVPTPSLLGLVSLPVANLNGLLFGFSVDGAGDYNNDGNPDIVVGAPAGINLSSLGGIFSGQVLGGSALVYYGDGTKVSSSIGATLQASSSGLLGNAANLFGYKVKGVRNSSGQHNGNILVSSPAGNVLSNLVSGLKLKAGSVNVFVKKTAAFSSPVAPNQSLSSPRSSSVLSLLTGQSLDVSLLYGAALDNARDINCDNFSDIIVGEPLSTNVPLVGANVTGGAAYVYRGRADGTYETVPTWSVYPEVSPMLGVNATSLVGYSVVGGSYSKGASDKPRVMAGGPANALDFGSGLLNIGNTVGTLYDFTFDNNGLGKAFGFATNLCAYTTLPLKLVSFSGTRNDQSAVLTWQSQFEQNFDRYELERSTNKNDYSTIAIIFAKNAAIADYACTDKRPATGANYYRLKMVDTDGKVSFSSTVLIRFDQAGGVMTIAPNPVRNDYKILFDQVKPGTYYLRLTNGTGQVLQTKAVALSQVQQLIGMSAANLSSGIYYLNLFDKEGKKLVETKLVVYKD